MNSSFEPPYKTTIDPDMIAKEIFPNLQTIKLVENFR